jgi:hypothetical protein
MGRVTVENLDVKAVDSFFICCKTIDISVYFEAVT